MLDFSVNYPKNKVADRENSQAELCQTS